MSKIVIYDPSIATLNVGDDIISESVNDVLSGIFKNAQFLNLPTHLKRDISTTKLAQVFDYQFIGGSNLLSPKMLRYRQFKISFFDLFMLRNMILVGTGWQCYQNEIDFIAKFFYRNCLSSKFKHSVRDQYTVERLNSIGIKNVINTGCATMWKLTPSHCSQIKTEKARTVVFTLTDYSIDINNDKLMINTLIDNYESIYFWPQGINDFKYFTEITNGVNKGINIIPPRLKDYSDFLASNDVDYVGTRLHGGIKALQCKKRTIIIGIDNRALEKQKDFNLSVLNRFDMHNLDSLINSKIKSDIRVNFENIEEFKRQFHC